MGYNYTILYRKGADNTVADALSRMHEDAGVSELPQEIYSWGHCSGFKEGGLSG